MNYQGIPVTDALSYYRDAEYKKEPAKRIFSYVQQYRQSLEKTEKNNTDLLDILDKLML